MAPAQKSATDLLMTHLSSLQIKAKHLVCAWGLLLLAGCSATTPPSRVAVIADKITPAQVLPARPMHFDLPGGRKRQRVEIRPLAHARGYRCQKLKCRWYAGFGRLIFPAALNSDAPIAFATASSRSCQCLRLIFTASAPPPAAADSIAGKSANASRW